MKIGQVMMHIILTVMILVVGFTVVGMVGALATEWRGDEKFNTLQDAYAYQSQVVDKALELNGKVLTADISVTSPPSFTFVVQMPDASTTFPLGQRVMPIIQVTIAQILFAVVSILFALGINLIMARNDATQ